MLRETAKAWYSMLNPPIQTQLHAAEQPFKEGNPSKSDNGMLAAKNNERPTATSPLLAMYT
jgi:hypothetical protein